MKNFMNEFKKFICRGNVMDMAVGIIIGAEGGFDDAEIKKAENAGGRIISLGKRILRTETAAITAAAMCMLYAEMNLNEESK